MNTTKTNLETSFSRTDWSDFLLEPPNRKDKIAQGKQLRKSCSRTSHANWKPNADRANPLALLQSQDDDRIPRLLPLRYGRMMASPLAFYRGSALIMANDLAQTPSSGLIVQCCGDSHLSNFGIFATPERNIVFDLNDFDETLPGPWEWDLKRLTASIAIAAKDKKFSTADCETCVRDTVREYKNRMEAFSQMSSLELWYYRLNVDDLLNSIRRPEMRPELAKKIEKMKQKCTHEAAVAKLTEVVDGKRRIKDSPPLITHSDDITPELIESLMQEYLSTVLPAWQNLVTRYHYIDVAAKTVGVGSVGTVAGVILLQGECGDSIFLQIKQARESVLERYVGTSTFAHHGHRVVTGQRLLQAASDIFLGWTKGPKGRHFYIRQLMDVKGSVALEDLDEMGLAHYGEVCAYALARAHARTGDPAMLHGYIGRGDALEESITKFAMSYADQNERDYHLLLDAVNKGKIAATPGL